MQKRRLLLMDLLSNFVAFLVFFNIFTFVLGLGSGRLNLVYLLSAVPFVFMLFLRKKVKKLRYFLSIHFSMLALPFAAWNDIRVFVTLMVLAVAMILYSIHRKGKDEWNMQGSTAIWMIVILTGLSMLYAVYLPEISGAGVLLNISSLLSLAAVVLYIHLDNMQFSMDLIGIAHHGNVVHASSVSNVLIIVFLIIIVIFGALSVFFPSDAAVLIMLQLFFDIIPMIFQFFALILRGITGELQSYEDVTMEGLLLGGEELLSLEDQVPEDISFLAIMNAIGRFLAMFGLAAVFIIFLITLFYRLYNAFRRKKRPEKKSLMPDDVVSKLKFVLGDFKEFLPRFKFDIKHPVRRAYIKKINGHIKQGLEVRLHYTPEIIADKVRPKENIDELTQKYEEVRYGRF